MEEQKNERLCWKKQLGLVLAPQIGNVYNGRELQIFVALIKQEDQIEMR